MESKMKTFECMCSECGYITQVTFTNYEYPQLGVQFESYCRQCEADTGFVRVPTRKALAEQKRQYEEQVIQKKIKDLCEQYGFGCRFVYQSVVITTKGTYKEDEQIPQELMYEIINKK